MKSIFGFGGVRVEMTHGSSNEYTRVAWFDGSFSDITYEPIMLERQNILYEDVSKLLGYKTKLDVKLINLKDDDYFQFGQLISIYNLIKQYPNGVLSIYPEYNPDIPNPGVYNLKLVNMRINSDFNPQQIANVEIGQTLKLSFSGKSLLSWIPMVFTNQETTYWVDESNNRMVDENGNYLIFKQD